MVNEMELGVAYSIRTKSFQSYPKHLDVPINEWLEENPDVEIIDIKFATAMSGQEWESEALVIYRKEV